MILDKLNTFAQNQLLDAGAPGTRLFGSIWDTIKNKDLSNVSGRFEIRITADATSGGAATLAFELVTSNNADMTAATVLWTSAAVALANLKAGYLLSTFTIPPTGQLRYLSMRQTTGVAAFTGGRVDIAYVHNHRNYNVPKVAAL